MRLKRAINALKEAIKRKSIEYEYEFGTYAAPRNTNDNEMFVIGPAMDIFPTSFKRAGPDIITAPGDISLKGVNTEIKVRTAPHVVKRNSAHNPLRCAVILCAISCTKNEAVRRSEKTEAVVHVHPSNPK